MFSQSGNIFLANNIIISDYLNINATNGSVKISRSNFTVNLMTEMVSGVNCEIRASNISSAYDLLKSTNPNSNLLQ